MVHVWSINSGERFQGHHGPLVVFFPTSVISKDLGAVLALDSVVKGLVLKQQILNSSELKRSADDNFKFDENSWKFSRWVENTVGKEEIARYEQFLLCPQCFQKTCFPGASKGVIVWKWVNSSPNNILDLTKLKAFAGDKLNIAKMTFFLY